MRNALKRTESTASKGMESMYFKFSDKVVRSKVDKAHLWLYLNSVSSAKLSKNATVWIHVFKVPLAMMPNSLSSEQHNKLMTNTQQRLNDHLMTFSFAGGSSTKRRVTGAESGADDTSGIGSQRRMGIVGDPQGGGRLVPLERR